MTDPDDYQRHVAAAVMQAIFDASLVADDGTPTAYVVSTEIVSALINVMAAILEGTPGCETPRAIRELTENIGRKILVQMREMRSIIAETGQRPFDVVYTRSN
jgi:hypothetical protein